jgi:hypothetical protein
MPPIVNPNRDYPREKDFKNNEFFKVGPIPAGGMYYPPPKISAVITGRVNPADGKIYPDDPDFKEFRAISIQVLG